MNHRRPFPLVLSALFLLTLALPARPARAGLDVWTPIGPYGGTVTVLRSDPVHAGRVYAGTQENGVFRSDDGGASWTPVHRGLPIPARSVDDLVVTPTDPPVLYLGFDNRFARSLDGESWEWHETGAVRVHPLAGSPVSPDVVWGSCQVGGSGLWICRTGDAGRTWEHLEPVPAHHVVSAIVLDPRSPSTVYAALPGYDPFVLRSRDGGATWERVGAGLPAVAFASNLSLDVARNSGHLFLAMELPDGGAPVFRSTDQGETWAPSGPGGFPVAAGAGGFVVTGSGARSFDGGATWRPGPGIPGRTLSLAVDPFVPRRALAGLALLGVYRTLSGVSAWHPSSQGMNATEAVAIAADPSAPGTLYASVRGGGLFRSTNGGGAWRRLEPGPRDSEGLLDIRELVVDGASTVYGILSLDRAGQRETVVRGEDGGAVWTDLRGRGLPPIDPEVLAVDPRSPGVLYVGGGGGACGLLKTLDSGETWACLWTGAVMDIAVEPDDPDNVYIVSDQIYRSSNGGASWRPASGGILPGTAARVAVAPSKPRILYAWARTRGILRSEDAGQTWSPATGNLFPFALPTSLVVDPRRAATVYATIQNEIYRTTNGGRTWHRLAFPGAGLWNGVLILDPEDPDTLYAGTHHRGFFTVTLSR